MWFGVVLYPSTAMSAAVSGVVAGTLLGRDKCSLVAAELYVVLCFDWRVKRAVSAPLLIARGVTPLSEYPGGVV